MFIGAKKGNIGLKKLMSSTCKILQTLQTASSKKSPVLISAFQQRRLDKPFLLL